MAERITQEQALEVLKFIGKPTNFVSERLREWLFCPEGQQIIIKKILTFAALHLEEIPKPEAVIMPFCDIAGRDDYRGHGETIEDALFRAVLEMLKGYE